MMCIDFMFTLTLLANPEKESLSKDTVHLIEAALSMQGIAVEKTQWRRQGIACELLVDKAPDMQAILRGHAFDAIVQPHPKPRYKLLVADMESTIITCECLDELADYVGLRGKIEAITARAMNGEMDFATALSERVALLKGLPESTLQEVYDKKVRLMDGANELLAAMKKNGAYCMLVSGGFDFYTTRIKSRLGFDEERSNKLEIKNGVLTGRVIAPILDKTSKLQALQDGCKKLGIAPSEALAIGDGANDLPMLLAAGLGIAYHAKPAVRAQASAQLNHCNLSVLSFIAS
jgi:phosphoserine phosphatase